MRLKCLLVLLFVALCHGRTTQKKPAEIKAQITSLNDKDNRRKAMEHPAFEHAGQQAGTEIWRIENFEPVVVPQKDYGKFYKGDSYIILKTKADKKGKLSWDIHYWLGAATTQDEAGAAAILTVGLDDKFNGAPIQHREVQGHESTQFLGYFQPAIRYVDGGHASGFNHVTINAGAEKRLFQVKGKRNIRVRQVDPLISSMNKGDVFILDVDHTIFVYVGEKSKNVEKLKAISVANQVRDQDHNGRGKVEIIDQYSSDVDFEKFFAALGSGSRDTVPEESAGGDDQAFEKSEEQTITLSEISDKTGSLKITPLSKPYKQEQLHTEECYILDTVSGSIYVWVGKKSSDREKTEAMAKAQQYLESKNYPSWVHVGRVPQGAEPAAFKQYFTTWRDVGMSHSRLVRSPSDEDFFDSDDEVSTKRARIISKTGAARGFMPDDGTGSYVVYRIEDMELERIYDSEDAGSEPGKRFGEMYQGDSYVMQYEYDGDSGRGHIIYFWLGKDSTQDETAAAAIHAVTLDRELSGKATIVRVPQGEEPKHFLKIFKGRLVTLLGGKASGFKNSNHKDSYDDDGVRLFRVHGAVAGEDMRAEQVEEIAGSLDSDDVFILETPEAVYLWYGEDSSESEHEEGAKFIEQIFGEGKDYTVVNQGEEPEEFWSHLGDSTSIKVGQRWRDLLGRRIGTEPKLFEVTFNSENKINFEEIPNYGQKDLQEDEMHLLDTGEEIYVWTGNGVSDQMRKSGNIIADGYLRRGGHSPNSAVVVIVKEGLEPELFKRLFDDWDSDMWKKQRTYEEERDEALANNEIDSD